MNNLKEFIEPLVKRDKKAEKIIASVNNTIKTIADLDLGYKSLGMKADTAEVTFANSNLQGYGKEDEVIGTLFTMKQGQMSKPVKGQSGCFYSGCRSDNSCRTQR